MRTLKVWPSDGLIRRLVWISLLNGKLGAILPDNRRTSLKVVPKSSGLPYPSQAQSARTWGGEHSGFRGWGLLSSLGGPGCPRPMPWGWGPCRALWHGLCPADPWGYDCLHLDFKGWGHLAEPGAQDPNLGEL